MEDDQPILFTPLVGQAGESIPDWFLEAGGLAGLPAPLLPIYRVSTSLLASISSKWSGSGKYLKNAGERFLRRVFTDNEILQCRGKVTRLAGRFAAREAMT